MPQAWNIINLYKIEICYCYIIILHNNNINDDASP